MTAFVDATSWAGSSLAHRLDRIARARSGSVAVVDGDTRVTYAELLGRADALAGELAARGIGRGDLVGVSLPRSADLVVAVVGVVRAGAAYVPLDVTHPEERRAVVIADAAPRVVVAHEASAGGVPAGIEILPLPSQPSGISPSPPFPGPDDPAYVIYTSGSTGRPKGVVVSHHNVSRLFTTTAPIFEFGPADVWSLFHSIAFDFSVWEMWGALLHGGRLVVVPSAVARDADAFHALVVREGVTVLNQTPSAFLAFDAADAAAGRPANSLRHIVFGGEALDPRTLADWFDAHGDSAPRVVNMYGITETTVHTTWRRMCAADARSDGASLIGAPLADLRIDLLDDHGRAVADGEVGEIHVGGDGVAVGYLRRDQLTAERFVPDPHGTRPGARLYRSGDRARRRPDGDLEYLGRADLQVKLGGFRIELGEVEAALRDAPGVREAVAALREDSVHGARIIAYLVPDGVGAALDRYAIWEHAARRLPEHMLPAAYVAIPAVPRTVNDKLDRTTLPQPTSADLPRGPGREAPRPGTEETIAAIWREILGVDDVGRDDDFFRLGGRSLSAVRVVARIVRDLGVTIRLRTILDAPTLSELSAAVDERLPGVPAPSTCVLRLRYGDGGAPLFCLPGVGGHVFQYRELVDRMRSNRAIFGLQLHDLDVPPKSLESVDRTAEAFVREMQTVQPGGPYALTGYSYGGIVAIEIARRLMEQGESVSFLGLIDTYAPGSTTPEPVLTKLRKHAANVVVGNGSQGGMDYIGSRIRRRMRRLAFRVREIRGTDERPSHDIEQRVEEASVRCLRAIDGYVARRFAGRLTVFHATRLMDWVRIDDATGTCGWGPLCDGVDVVEIDCKHLDFFVEPHISVLARRLDEALDRTFAVL